MEDSYDRRYLCLTHKNKMYGFAYLHYDQTTFESHRCYIRHFSTLQVKHYEKAMEAVVKYVWETVLCNDIRM